MFKFLIGWDFVDLWARQCRFPTLELAIQHAGILSVAEFDGHGQYRWLFDPESNIWSNWRSVMSPYPFGLGTTYKEECL